MAVLLFCAEPSRAAVTLPFYDGFAYSNNTGLGVAGSGSEATWTVGNSSSAASPLVTNAAALSDSGLPAATGLGVYMRYPGGSGKERGVDTASYPMTGAGETLYASFLLNVQSYPASNCPVAYFDDNGSASGSFQGVGMLPDGRLTLYRNATVAAPGGTNTTPLNSNTTYLIVFRYKAVANSLNDELALWINPPLGQANETATDLTINTGGADRTTLQGFFLKQDTSFTASLYFDELRLGANWTDVTPANGAPDPTPVPVVTQLRLELPSLIVKGSNGTPNGAFQVIASTNLAAPRSNWTFVAAHTFDASGNFQFTNPIHSDRTHEFFRLLVGATNSPPISAAPSITNQPQGLTLAAGATANFLVGATGTAPLHYFWSFNTNTPVGGNSNTLTLLNVPTNDAGGYRVVVSNSIGSVTSTVALLTVLLPPAITAHPTNLTVVSGGSAVFSVSATGSVPLHYQWYFNTNSPIANATNAMLALSPINTTNAGAYSVVITNAVGVVTSSIATLTVLGPPAITTQPQSQSVAVSNSATFTVTATGTAPLAYQWFFNTNTSVGGNSNVFTLLIAQTSNAGTYSVIITNNYGVVTSTFATLTIGAPLTNNARFNLVGFGEGTTGGGVIAETNSAYRKVYTDLEFATAVRDAQKTAGSVKVIEIMNDLDLGWNEIDPAVTNLSSTPFSKPVVPKLHPVLMTSGVSTVQISPKSGLTIFSAHGAVIKHASWSIKATANVIIRNLKFDELWEWDEESKGGYDKNNWDFIVIGVGGGTVDHIWVDHCTFTKAYDGITDNKGGCHDITYSWNKYMGDDGAANSNSFIWQQINALEATYQSNPATNEMYSFLRSAGFSITNIFKVLQGPGKLLAIGELSKDPVNTNSVITFHHQWYINPSDRIPRLAGGQAHNFNIYADCTEVLAARRMRDDIYNAMTTAQKNTYTSRGYSFGLAINGSISTEDGALLVEKSVYIDCLWPLRNNQTDPSDPTYTGKILGLDTIYSFRNSNGTTNYVRGNSTDPGNPLGPFQATIKPFSWNTNTAMPNAQLPYTYTMDDPSQLSSIVTNATSGAGAGVLNWNKTNWLMTSY